MNWSKARFLGYGVLIGTAGIRILTSDDAKKVYTHITGAVLRGYEETAKTLNVLKENCGDILADAKEINRSRKEKEAAAVIEDTSETAEA